MDGNDGNATDEALIGDETERAAQAEPIATDEDETTAPPVTDPDNGLTLVGDYPLNHRLRAQALARDGKTEDTEGHVTPELIAAHAESLAAIEAARPTVHANMKRDELVEIAAREGVVHEGDANRTTIAAAIQAHRETSAA